MAAPPTFSVILPLHDVAPWLPECLASLRAQTWADWEGLCVDDGSTEGTGAVLTEAVRGEARLRAVFQPPSGVGRARNRALERSRGDVVAFMDGDDTVAPWWLEEGFRLLRETQADLIRFAFLTRPERGVPHRDRREGRHWVFSGRREVQCWGWMAFVCGGYNWLLIIRRTLAQRVHYVETLRVKEDCVYALDLLPALRCVCVSESAPYCYRRRRGSALHTTCSLAEPLHLFAEARRLLRPPLPSEASAARQAALAVFVLQALVDWASHPRRAECRRFDEVRTSFAAFLADGIFTFQELVRPHWRPTVRMFLRFGWVWPMTLHGFAFRVFLKIKWRLLGPPACVQPPIQRQRN